MVVCFMQLMNNSHLIYDIHMLTTAIISDVERKHIPSIGGLIKVCAPLGTWRD